MSRLLKWLVRALFAPVHKERQTSRKADPTRTRSPWQQATAVPSADSVATAPPTTVRRLKGRAYVIDGDTIVLDNEHLRLAGIDAPELDHPYGQKAKWAMVALCKGQTVSAHIIGQDHYGRVVAVCSLSDGRDLSAEMVRQGHAIDWPKFSGGRYAALEVPGIRKRLWRCDYRQRGLYHNETRA